MNHLPVLLIICMNTQLMGDQSFRTVVNVNVCVRKCSPLPGTGGFSWEPTMMSITTTTNMGTLHEPVRDTKNRFRNQDDEFVFFSETCCS